MKANCLIEGADQSFAGATPPKDVAEPDARSTGHERVGVVLMSDRVSPEDELVEQRTASGVAGIASEQVGPELETQPPEVSAEVAGRWISTVELTTEEELTLDQVLNRRRPDARRDVIDGFEVEVPAEALKLPCEREHGGLVEPKQGGSSSRASASDEATHGLELVEGGASLLLPQESGSRRHARTLP